MNKPVVHYRKLYSCTVGAAALCVPVDHPGPMVSNKKAIATSEVLRYDPDTGEFETRNTVYRRQPQVLACKAERDVAELRMTLKAKRKVRKALAAEKDQSGAKA